MSDFHEHKCPKCGTIWKHDRDAIPRGKMYAAHDCPAEGCDGHETWQYDGDGVPAYCHNGARTIRLAGASARELAEA